MPGKVRSRKALAEVVTTLILLVVYILISSIAIH